MDILIFIYTDEESVVLRSYLSFKIRPIRLQSPALSPCHNDGNSDGNEGEKQRTRALVAAQKIFVGGMSTRKKNKGS